MLLAIANYFRQDLGVEDWEAVGKAVRRRRLELGITQDQAVARSGGMISIAVWRLLESARQTHYRDRSLAGVAKALGWTIDSIDRIHAGEDPVMADPGSTEASPTEPSAVEMRVAAKTGQLPPGKLPELEQYIDFLLSQSE